MKKNTAKNIVEYVENSPPFDWGDDLEECLDFVKPSVKVGDCVYIIHDGFDIVPAIVREILDDGKIACTHQGNGTSSRDPWQVNIRHYKPDEYCLKLDEAKVKVLQNIDNFISKKIRNYQGD